MAYVPMQEFTDIYEPEQGFSRGTIFAEVALYGKGIVAVNEREVLLKRVQVCDFAL